MVTSSPDHMHQKSSRSQPASESANGTTLRVVVLSLLLAAFFGYIAPIIDHGLSDSSLGAMPFPPGAILVLLALVLVINPLLRLLSRARFSRNEILTVYISCLFSCLVPGHGAENIFVPTLIGSFYFATKENKWLEFLQPYIKPWISPALTDTGAINTRLVEGWYMGLPAGQQIPWGAWLVPLLAWFVLLLALYTMLGCLGIMVRAQWAGNEALAFPLLSIPLKMSDTPTSRGPSLWNNRLLWIGFAVTFGWQFVNGINTWFPDVPIIPRDLVTDALLTEAPWNQLGLVWIKVVPMAVGITFLLNSEVAFSLWFFYWAMKIQYLLAYACGFPVAVLPDLIGSTAQAKTFTGFQQVGSFYGYAALLIWMGRDHWKHIVARALGRVAARPDESEEALSYPLAFWGFTLSFAVLLTWSIAAGIRLDMALLLWGTYLVIAIVMARIVAEGGLVFVQQGWAPLGAIAQLLGPLKASVMVPSSVVPAAIVQTSLMTDMGAFLLPSFLHTFKLAHDRKIDAKRLLALIAAVILISLSLGIWQAVRLGYHNGGLSMHVWWAQAAPRMVGENVSSLLTIEGKDWANNWRWFGVGAAETYLLMALRSRFFWFPLHPIGIMTSLSYPMHVLWLSIFIGWLSKTLVIRFGGHDTYQAALPFIYGIIVGDICAAMLWLVVDGFQGRMGHIMLPG